ncbi:MAG: PorT family protein [Flavobacteriales bacterium]|nr:PorT family protein [Flavobacteriales bacterium]
MKHLILTVNFCLITLLALQAQKLSIGPELGINVIPVENSNMGKNFQMGYHIGAQLKIHVSEHFKLGTGLYFTQKKKMYQQNDTSSVFDLFGSFIELSGLSAQEVDSLVSSFGANTDVTEETKGVVAATFVKIPLLATYHYKNFNLYGGPYAGFLIMANRKEETRTQIPLMNVIDVSQFDSTGLFSAFLPAADETTTSQTSGTDGLNKMDVGFIAGIGYEMNQLHFNLMYSQGLLDYRDDRGKEDFSALSTFRFSIAYLFDLKGNKEASPRLE